MSTLLGQITGSFPTPTLLERPAGVLTRPRVILTAGARSPGYRGQGRASITLFPEGGEVPQPGPVHDGFRRRDARSVPWHPDAEYAGRDRAGHRRRHHDRLAVDADRDLGRIGGDLDLRRGQCPEPAAARAPEQADGLPGAVHLDADDAENAAVQPRSAAQAGDVT